MTNILIVEDEPIARELLVAQVESEGYTVLSTGDGNKVEEIVDNSNIDLILLDVRIPGKDGFTLTRNLRANSNIGIILVTGKKDDVDRIVGLELGADDYISKPFNQRELMARVKSLVFRLATQEKPEQHKPKSKQFGKWYLDTVRRELRTEGKDPVSLKSSEFSLLSALTDNAGVMMSRDEIMTKMRNRDWAPSDRSIDVLIAHIRKKLDDDSTDPSYIKTIHGSGYVFVSDVSLN